MESVSQVQIPDEAVYVFGKGMNPSVLFPVMDK